MLRRLLSLFAPAGSLSGLAAPARRDSAASLPPPCHALVRDLVARVSDLAMRFHDDQLGAKFAAELERCFSAEQEAEKVFMCDQRAEL